MAFLCAHFSIIRILSGSRWLPFCSHPSTQHKRHFVDETHCVVEQIESSRSERLRGRWNHGSCSEYTFSVLRARRMAFSCEACKANTMTAVQMHNEVRLLSKPEWLHRYLFDLIATQRIHACKPLPRQEAALLVSCWRQLKPVAKRRKIEEIAEEQYNPKALDDGLFMQLKISNLSLPSCLRPEKNAR